MSQDMCVPCEDGLINIRSGAILMKNGKLLMVKGAFGYYYTVGGRIKFGETAEEAAVREVWEETGVRLNVKRLAFVHENYFTGDSPSKAGMPIYELCLYWLMDVPEDFEPVNGEITDGEEREALCWVSPDTPERIYPEFFKTELPDLAPEVRFFSSDDR